MVDFKLFLNPPISRNLDFLRRRCNRRKINCPNFSNISCVSGCKDDETLISNEHENNLTTKQRCILIAVLVGLAVGISIFLYANNYFSKTPEELVPPDPSTSLPPSASKLRIFKNAAVCVDAAPCAEIGRNIFEKNGSAIDATIAAMFCNGVVTMQSMGLGGGFLMTIYKRNERKAYFLNAREKAPLAATDEIYKNSPDTSQHGALAAGVPGEVKGYWAAHQKFGILPWEELVKPAIDICERGYNMSAHQYSALFKNNLEGDPNFKEWFGDVNTGFKKMGSRIVPTKLCQTLRMIAKNGGYDLYNGTLSKLFLEDIKEAGGIITAEDLNKYEAEWREPVTITFKNQDQLFTAPPPGSGVLLAFIMNILDGYGFSREDISGVNNTVHTYHRIIEAFKYAYAKRTELGDTNFVNIKELLQNLTSREYADGIRLKIKDNSTSSDAINYGAVFFNTPDHGTAHLSVLAKNGDAVSVTSSVNIYFGAGVTSKQTGIILSSVMNDFSFPYFKSYFGLPGSPNNKLEPGKRPLSSMTPTILVDKEGDVRLVIGASGGTKITTTVAQVIMRVLWFGDNLKEAVDAPRIHHQLFPMQIEYEYGTLKQVVEGLKSLGHQVARNGGSIICAILKTANQIIGNADYRKGGDVFGL